MTALKMKSTIAPVAFEQKENLTLTVFLSYVLYT